MQGIFIEFVRNLRDPIRSRRQEKIREVELSWSDRELASFRAFVAGLQPAEMSDICFALSDATAIPLLELLIDLAETNNELMQVAMRSLAKVPVSAKLYLANRLFSSKNNLIRSEACGLLAGTSKAALPFFLKALDDASELVTISAIKAIMKLELSEAADKIVPKLRSGTEEIKSLAMDALSRLGGNSKLFEDGLLAIYNNAGEKVSLRGKAAQVLALAKSQASHNVLLETVSSGRDAPELLRLSALALSAWPDRKTIDLLLSVANRNVAILAEAARRSIGQMDSEKALPLLVASLKNDSAAMAMAAADALGGMRHPGAGMALCEHLPGEERPAVIAAVSDALGRSGFSGAWQALRTKLATSRGSSALTLLASLADAAREANLDELSVFLENAADEKSQELLLRRLAAFSQTLRPSLPVIRRAVDVLNSGNSSLSIPAMEILAYSGEEAIRTRLLTEMAYIGEEELPLKRLLREMLRQKRGELAALFKGCSPMVAPLLALAAAEADWVGGEADAFFNDVASWARNGAKGARAGLAAAAALEPARLVRAMSGCPDGIFMLEAWTSLPPRDRLRHSPDLESFFAASDATDRLAAVNLLARLGEARHLRILAMLAFTDKDAAVKSAAVSLVRRMTLGISSGSAMEASR